MTRKILNGVSDEFECHAIGHNYYGQVLKPGIEFEDGEKIKFWLHGTGKAKYSMDIITDTIRKYDIDIFGGLLDTFMLYEAGFMGVDTSPAKTFFYYPTDGGGGLPTNCEQVLMKLVNPVAMAQYGAAQVERCHGIKSHYIPHAFDPKLYYKMEPEDIKAAKAKFGLLGKFVVGTVARNQSRKMLERTLKAFKLFCENKPDAILFMHTDPTDVAASYDLKVLIDRYKMHNRVLFTGTSFFKAFTYSQMSEVYNTMDVFFLSTSGEGFGVPIIEAMAAGVPQVVTDYTTTKELLIDEIKTGECVRLCGEENETPWPHCDEVLNGTITGSWNVERGVMDIYHAAEILNKLYNCREYRYELSGNSVVKAQRYTWDRIIPMWRKFFRGLMK